jgi:Na+/melibiose symporter-like transporter
MKAISCISTVLFIVCVSVTLYSIEEKPGYVILDQNDFDSSQHHTSTKITSRPIIMLFVSQFFSWFSWFPVLFYASEYVQEYASFVQNKELMGSTALLGFSVCSIIASVVAPVLVSRLDLNLHKVLGCSHLVLALSMVVGTSLVSGFEGEQQKFAALMLLISFIGNMFALTLWIPVSLADD